MKNIPRPEHPRPQFMREKWINLNGEWEFEFDEREIGRELHFEKRNSLDMKIITLYNNMQSKINSSEAMLVAESDIDAVLQNQPSLFAERVKKMIERQSKDFTEKIINSLREQYIELKTRLQKHKAHKEEQSKSNKTELQKYKIHKIHLYNSKDIHTLHYQDYRNHYSYKPYYN